MISLAKFLALALIGISLSSCSRHETRETRYENGQPKEKFSVLETKDGSFIKDGEYNTWYPGDKPETAGQYENGKKTGNWKNWYLNGQLKDDCNYTRDTLDGEFIRWHENGQKLVETRQQMGSFIGPLTSWYENGQMESKLNYNPAGKFEGHQIYWHSNGKKMTEFSYSHGVLDGTMNSWDSNGHLYISREYKDGADVNLPAVYKNKTGEKLELFKNETYKVTYVEGYYFSKNWGTKSGPFRLDLSNLILEGFNSFSLKLFKRDSIVLYKLGVNEIVFVRTEK